MSVLEQLGPLPPITAELDLFDYVPLDSPRKAPPVELRARLVRRYDADDQDAEGLRLAFVAGHPVDSYDLLVLAYLWRSAPDAVVWGVERWSSPERRLRPYRHDPTFEPRAAADVHAELQSLGPASVASHARVLLASQYRLPEAYPPSGGGQPIQKFLASGWSIAANGSPCETAPSFFIVGANGSSTSTASIRWVFSSPGSVGDGASTPWIFAWSPAGTATRCTPQRARGTRAH